MWTNQQETADLVTFTEEILNGKNFIFLYNCYKGIPTPFTHRFKEWYIIFTAWKLSVFGVFLVRIFPHSDWIRRDIPYFSVFSLNAGKYGPEKLRTQTLHSMPKTNIFLLKNAKQAKVFLKTVHLEKSRSSFSTQIIKILFWKYTVFKKIHCF